MALWDTAACMELDRFLDARGIRHSPATLGSTLGSPPGGHGHAVGSNHYPEWWGGPRGSTGQARDFGDRSSDCEAIARALEPHARGRNYAISELIWTRSKMPLSRNGIYYKRGIAYTPSFSLARQHNDHVHAAIAVGSHLPGAIPQPPSLPKGFLMALTDAQQGDVYNMLTDLQQKANFGGGRHPNYGDIVNEVVKQVVAQLQPELERIRVYLTTP